MDRATRKKLLDAKKSELVEAIDADKIARDLSDRDGVSADIRDLILKQKTGRDKTTKLVAVLKTLTADKYELFCQVLAEQGHEKLAKQLMKKERDRPYTNNTKTRASGKTRASERNDKSSSAAASGNYGDVVQSCRNCFITDVSADPEGFVAKLESSKVITLSNDTKQKVESEIEAEAKAEILFEAVLPQVNEYGAFLDLVQVLKGPFQNLSDRLWEQRKNIVVPAPKSSASANRKAHSKGTKNLPPGTPASLPTSPQGNGDDVMTSLANLQSDLTESQSESLKQSLQLERCIQTTAEANNAIRKLNVQLRLSEEERDVAISQAETSKQKAEESRQQLETGLADANAERKRLEEQHHQIIKWEGEMRRGMDLLASKDMELKLRDEERRTLHRRNNDSLEKKGMQVVQRAHQQDRRSAENHVRLDRMREREHYIVMSESQQSQREEEIIRKESVLKKQEIELHRRKIEATRLEEQIKMMQTTQRKAANQLKQREQAVARVEDDVKIIGDRLHQREENLQEQERRINAKMLEAKEELQAQQSHLEEKERTVQYTEQEQRQWESALEAKAQELSNMGSEADQKEGEIGRREEELSIKQKELDSVRDVLDCRLQAQERMEHALRMIEVEQIRRDKEILNREAEIFNMSFPSQKKLEEMDDRMGELKKKDGEHGNQNLTSWIEVEQQRHDLELQKQQLMAEKSRREQEKEQEQSDQNEQGDDDQHTEVDSLAMSDATPDADQEIEMYGYEVQLKGARAVSGGAKASFDLNVAGHQTVAAFKNILDTEEGIPAGWQSLIMSGKVLDDSQALPGNKNSKLQLQLKLTPPIVKERDILKLKVKSCNGKTHSIDFSLEDTVATAKSRIYKYTGIPPHQQQLSYKEVLLENHATLQLYSIRKNASLDLRLRFRVIAEFSSDQKLEITADEINTLANIKANIFEQTKLPLDNFKVSYKGKQLEDHRTLAHYCIGEGATLTVTCILVVKMMSETNTEVILDVELGATVHQVKQLLVKKKLVNNGDRLCLVCGDQVLDDDQDVMDVVRSGKDIAVHAGNVLVMSESSGTGNLVGNSDGEQKGGGGRSGRKSKKPLDLSVVGSHNLP